MTQRPLVVSRAMVIISSSVDSSSDTSVEPESCCYRQPREGYRCTLGSRNPGFSSAWRARTRAWGLLDVDAEPSHVHDPQEEPLRVSVRQMLV